MKLYLAGPDVFMADAVAMGEAKKALCEQYGHEGLFPLDTELNSEVAGDPVAKGLAISAANEALIKQADGIVANLTPFRGPSADAGTLYELGLARGLGKHLFAYTNDASLFCDRTLAMLDGTIAANGDWVDHQGMSIERFDLHDNLMIEGGIQLAGGIFLVHRANPAQRWSDLTGFEQLLQQIPGV